MAASSYDGALLRLLAHEGGYTNHPSDPGGPTNFGITIIDYRKYVKPTATAADVKTMKLDEAKRIYRAKYWDAQRCDELPAGVDYAVFDYGVNSGVGRSGKVLRRVLNLPDTTSTVNTAVILAARAADPKALVKAICDERLRFLKALKTWPVFGGGWGRRVAEVRSVSLALAAAASGAVKIPQPPDVEPAPPKPKPDKALKVGTAGTAGSAAGLAASEGGFPIWAAVLIAIAVGAAAYFFINKGVK